MGTSAGTQAGSIEGKRQAQRKWGLVLMAVGVTGLLAAITVAIMATDSPTVRVNAAMGCLLMWGIWFTGKTLFKFSKGRG